VPIRICLMGIGTRMARMKRLAIALAACTALSSALGACGGDESTTSSPGASVPTSGSSAPSRTATTTTTPQGGGLEHPNAGRPGGGGEEPIRVPATFTLRGGRLSPRTVSVPPFLAIAVSVRSLDSTTRVVTVHADRVYRLTVAARGCSARTLPGQRAGRYTVTVRGGGRATLVVGGEPGP
jgi:hypothetical protein